MNLPGPLPVPLPARPPRFMRWLLVFVLGGAALYLGAVVWTGRGLVEQAFVRLGWGALAGGTAVANMAYLLRFWRWHRALAVLHGPVPVGFNLRVYLSGLALTTSPGKVGETLRSVLLAAAGVPVRRSLACFLADRLSDVLGVCLLGACAGAWLGRPLNIAAAALAGIVAASFAFRAVVRHPARWQGLRARMPGWMQGSGALAAGTLQDWSQLWRPGRVLLFTAIAAAAYGLQAMVFCFFCQGLGIAVAPARALEIFVNATLLGAASMVPGGLGTMEASMVLQLAGEGATTADGVSAAIACRLATLWTGVVIGLAALASLGRSWHGGRSA
ncbi:UPF0104 family protein [Xylophilus sp. Kf1]|nr:UPF0104 family protein [Xylophilus sp. Kf1]